MDHRLVKGSVQKCLKGVSRPAEIESFSPLSMNCVPVRSRSVGNAQIGVAFLTLVTNVLLALVLWRVW
jgi:hypothetical protein